MSHKAKILKLPFTDDPVENQIIMLCKNLIRSDKDYTPMVMMALLGFMESCQQVDEDPNFIESYNNLKAALLWYYEFSESD